MLLLLLLFIFAIFQPLLFASHSSVNHVVIGEIQIAGATATDEFVELYNPTDCPISLSAWKLVKKTSGGTEYNLVSSLSGDLAAHGFFLIAPQTGYDGTQEPDLRYSQTSNTMAANNAVLLYADQAKTTLVDKVGFADPGTPVDAEGSPAPNPAVHGSLTRSGGNDTNNNAVDFAFLDTSAPQNSHSPLDHTPGACTTPPPPPTSSPIPPSSPPPAVAGTALLSIAEARQRPNGQSAGVSGVVSAPPGVLSASSFYIQDRTGGLQIYSSQKLFPPLAVGQEVEVTGELSEAFSEKRMKISSADAIRAVGNVAVQPRAVKTGAVNESLEGILIAVTGSVSQTSGNTFYLDDGSGQAKIYIRDETGIDKPRMQQGDHVAVIGIVSQYKTDYRVLPRYQEDLDLSVAETIPDDQTAGAALAASSQVGELAPEATPAVVTFNPPTSSVAPVMSSPSPTIRILGWTAITLGIGLLLLIPCLLWLKRKNISLSLLPKRNNSSAILPKP